MRTRTYSECWLTVKMVDVIVAVAVTAILYGCSLNRKQLSNAISEVQSINLHGIKDVDVYNSMTGVVRLSSGELRVYALCKNGVFKAFTDSGVLVDSVDYSRELTGGGRIGVYSTQVYADSLVLSVLDTNGTVFLVIHKLGAVTKGNIESYHPTLPQHVMFSVAGRHQPLRVGSRAFLIPFQYNSSSFLTNDTVWHAKFSSFLAAMYSLEERKATLRYTWGRFPSKLVSGSYYYDVSPDWCMVTDETIAVAFPFENDVTIRDVANGTVTTIAKTTRNPEPEFRQFERGKVQDYLSIARYMFLENRYLSMTAINETTLIRVFMPGAATGSRFVDYANRDWEIHVNTRSNSHSYTVNGAVYSVDHHTILSLDSIYVRKQTHDHSLVIARLAVK